MPAISAGRLKSCALQNVPDGCLVACCEVFDTFDQAVDVLRMLATDFPLNFSPEMKIQGIQISRMGRPDD